MKKNRLAATGLALQMIDDIRTEKQIYTSHLDDDFYKFTINQFFRKFIPDVNGVFAFKNRTKSIRFPMIVPIEAIKKQFDMARTVVWTSEELDILRKEGFQEWFIEEIKNFKLGPYEIRVVDDEYEITFSGKLKDVSLWEIPCLYIMSELKSRYVFKNLMETKGLNVCELTNIYEMVLNELENSANIYKELGADIVEMGTRRRHSKAYHEAATNLLNEVMGKNLLGTSNVMFAHKYGLKAIGTNAHEIPMTFAALARKNFLDGNGTLEQFKNAQYDCLRLWGQMYPDKKIILPDTFGSTQFFENAPEEFRDWDGYRPDSKEPVEATKEGLAFFKNPNKRNIPSDGLDAKKVQEVHPVISKMMKTAYGIGTSNSNGFEIVGINDLKPASLVCKVKEVEGTPCVKLSDNYDKATGPKEEVNFYREQFGHAGMHNAPVLR